MSAKEQIDALRAQIKYQIQQIPDEGAPSALGSFDTPTEAQQSIGQAILEQIGEGFLFGSDPRATEFPSAVYVHRSTVEMRPVEVVEGHRYQIVERSAWDTLSPEESDALLVQHARETGQGDTFPVEWLPAKEQEAERVRRQPQPAPTSIPLQG